MNKSYFALSRGSAVSGAGSYSHKSPKISCGTEPLAAAGRAIALGVVISIALGSLCEIIGRLVSTGLFFLDLPEQVVEQRARAETIASGIQPRVAQCFLDCDQVVQRLLGGSDAACGLHSDCDAGRQIKITDRFDHHLSVSEAGASRSLAGARLDEVPGTDHLHRQKRSGSHVIVSIELTDFENDLH